MKQQILFFRRTAALSVSLLLLLASGCTHTPGDSPDTAEDANTRPRLLGSTQTAEDTEPEEEETAFPGTYTVPEGWVKLDKYSTKEKIFYVEEGHEDDALPDNISIEIGSNRYSAAEHETFRSAILQQLTMQISGLDAELLGSGTYTEQDYVLYIFTINEESVVTKQYYIVGEQQYCLIHLTKFTDSESADEAAQAMADSFIWN